MFSWLDIMALDYQPMINGKLLIWYYDIESETIKTLIW